VGRSLLGSEACVVDVPPAGEVGPTRGRQTLGKQCCVWIDLDGTLNTLGAFGYPFNPVPADRLCQLLGDRQPAVRSSVLTARSGCLPKIKPLEHQCAFLGDGVSVSCYIKGKDGKSAKQLMAEAKQAHLLQQNDTCSRHVLIDDNQAAAQIDPGAPYTYIRPSGSNWPQIRQQVEDALAGCSGVAEPGSDEPPPESCHGLCGDQAPAGCWCDGACVDNGDCCPDQAQLCESS